MKRREFITLPSGGRVAADSVGATGRPRSTDCHADRGVLTDGSRRSSACIGRLHRVSPDTVACHFIAFLLKL